LVFEAQACLCRVIEFGKNRRYTSRSFLGPAIALAETCDTPRRTTEDFQMYAVMVTGGKQYRVMKGETLRVEKLEVEAGGSIDFDQVLMIGDGESITVGAPVVTGAVVTASVKGHGRADKVRIVKFRRRKHHRKQMGHRQHYTEIEITQIQSAGISA